ncbi:leucyl aminopeptidase [Lichenihabitans psoromatis]|uniref:leucyl aminopeptidase n=1 Tax=Lichenihabitans psoromatis TaxID=2528642 RepID=UPI00103856BE|nr:leucyl aminopeptidase [Lichenihabitans psoromatis]
MATSVAIEFVPLDKIASDTRGSLVVFAGEGLTFGSAASSLLEKARPMLQSAAGTAKFKGRTGTVLDILAPADVPADRLLVVGLETDKPQPQHSSLTLGGAVMGKLKDAETVTVVFDGPDATAEAAADFALGLKLRAYRFDKYKTKKKDDAEKDGHMTVRLAVADVAAAQAAVLSRDAIADGVQLARTLVNEPPNVLFPIEFANRAAELEKLGVEIDILDEAAAEKIGMRALLAVGLGSEHESRVVIMRWNGATDKDEAPVAFIGKGVCFDSGGISIKPGAGMEDMKGDMAGAACVVGLMHALAARKAKANVIGAIGIVENMPDGRAQRPGDIVTSLSGQTIEIINTDAEGRLVLGDVLWYVQDKYKPQFMVDLATLTGAIIVALGHEHAGLFSNNDELSQKLLAAGIATGEKVWRMPLGPSYDKLIDSKFADMKNTGGRHGGSITAAQFIQRFVNDTPWAHLDIAGTGMGSPADEINQSWGSGWGVRLLDRLVADHYEK